VSAASTLIAEKRHADPNLLPAVAKTTHLLVSLLPAACCSRPFFAKEQAMSIVDQTKQLVEELSEAGQSLAHSAADMVSHAAEAVSESVESLSQRIGEVIEQVVEDDAPANPEDVARGDEATEEEQV
jgi:gas vesicle protein